MTIELFYMYAVPYLIVFNLFGFGMCAYDKRRAIKKRRRVSEWTLFWTALLGGAAGIYTAMMVMRHKTKKWKFRVFVPTIIVFHAAIIFFALYT